MKLKCLFVSVLSLSSFAFAGTMGPINTFNPSLYFKVGSGGSYSMNTNIQANDSNLNNWPSRWLFSNEGYNHSVGNTALYSAAIGYNFSPLWSADIEYIYRPSYSYNVFQTPLPSEADALTPPRTRHFDLQSNSLMGNLYLHGRGLNSNLNWDTSYGFSIEPFIGAGLGVAFNTISNFHSIRSTGESSAYEQDKLRTSLAWQLSAGLNFYNDGHFNLGAGYRYYNGTTFSSNDNLIDTLVPSYAWRGTIQANEFFITLAYKINA